MAYRPKLTDYFGPGGDPQALYDTQMKFIQEAEKEVGSDKVLTFTKHGTKNPEDFTNPDYYVINESVDVPGDFLSGSEKRLVPTGETVGDVRRAAAERQAVADRAKRMQATTSQRGQFIGGGTRRRTGSLLTRPQGLGEASTSRRRILGG